MSEFLQEWEWEPDLDSEWNPNDYTQRSKPHFKGQKRFKIPPGREMKGMKRDYENRGWLGEANYYVPRSQLSEAALAAVREKENDNYAPRSQLSEADLAVIRAKDPVYRNVSEIQEEIEDACFYGETGDYKLLVSELAYLYRVRNDEYERRFQRELAKFEAQARAIELAGDGFDEYNVIGVIDMAEADANQVWRWGHRWKGTIAIIGYVCHGPDGGRSCQIETGRNEWKLVDRGGGEVGAAEELMRRDFELRTDKDRIKGKGVNGMPDCGYYFARLYEKDLLVELIKHADLGRHVIWNHVAGSPDMIPRGKEKWWRAVVRILITDANVV